MVDRPSLSKGEMEVARLLWEIGPATVRQTFEALPKRRKMDFSTVQTYLRRLEKKGYATSTLDGRIRVYAARAKARTVIRETGTILCSGCSVERRFRWSGILSKIAASTRRNLQNCAS